MCTKNMEFLKILSPVGLMLYESLLRERFQEFSISTSSATSSTSPMSSWRPASRKKLMLLQNLLKTQFLCIIQLIPQHCRFVPSHLQFCFFVGSEGPCSPDLAVWTLESKRAAMQIAKRNVEEHYSVVGLTSDLKGTVKLLEAYLPRFFKGTSWDKERL